MPARRPPLLPHRRRAARAGAEDDRAVLAVEPLEDRLQPSTTALDPLPLPLPAVPFGAAAIVRVTDAPTPAVTSAPTAFATAQLRRELVLIDRDVADRDTLVRGLLASRAPGTVVGVVELTGGGVAE